MNPCDESVRVLSTREWLRNQHLGNRFLGWADVAAILPRPVPGELSAASPNTAPLLRISQSLSDAAKQAVRP